MGQNAFGNIWRIEAVGNDYGNINSVFNAKGVGDKGGAWHGLGYGWDRRFVPADAAIDDVDAGRLELTREYQGLVGGLRVVNEIKHR